MKNALHKVHQSNKSEEDNKHKEEKNKLKNLIKTPQATFKYEK